MTSAWFTARNGLCKKSFDRCLRFSHLQRLTGKIAFLEKEFTEVVGTHEKIIHKVCWLYSDSKADRQDLFQDILLQLWRSFPSFRKDAKVSTWIYRVALNTAISRVRKVSRVPQNIELNDEDFDVSEDDDEQQEQFDEMMHAIERLSPMDKAITLLYLDDCSYREIAEVIGISESNVGFKLTQIRSKLKTLMGR